MYQVVPSSLCCHAVDLRPDGSHEEGVLGEADVLGPHPREARLVDGLLRVPVQDAPVGDARPESGRSHGSLGKKSFLLPHLELAVGQIAKLDGPPF